MIKDGDAGLGLGGLMVEVARYEPLDEKLHAVHLCLGAASAVAAALAVSELSAEALDGA
jgi:hypothetical protein